MYRFGFYSIISAMSRFKCCFKYCLQLVSLQVSIFLPELFIKISPRIMFWKNFYSPHSFFLEINSMAQVHISMQKINIFKLYAVDFIFTLILVSIWQYLNLVNCFRMSVELNCFCQDINSINNWISHFIHGPGYIMTSVVPGSSPYYCLTYLNFKKWGTCRRL